MEELTLKQLTRTLTVIKQLLVMNEEGKIDADDATLEKYADYEVIAIEPILESEYNEMFKTMHVKSGLRVVIIKN